MIINRVLRVDLRKVTCEPVSEDRGMCHVFMYAENRPDKGKALKPAHRFMFVR